MTMTFPRSIIFGLATLGVLGVFALALNSFDLPGLMRAGFRVRDHDPVLEKDAATAKPVIEALEKYHAKNSAYPASGAEMLPFFAGTPPPSTPPSVVNGWVYSRNQDGKGYELAFKLGWDADLLYLFDGTRGMWVFAPGNGSANKEIQLGP